MSCPNHSSDWSCAGCEKLKSIRATNELNNIIDVMKKEKEELVKWLTDEESRRANDKHWEDIRESAYHYDHVLDKIKELEGVE